jgi:hypothetical protein
VVSLIRPWEWRHLESIMKISIRNLVILAALTFLGLITHLVPHSMGVSTVGALSMLAAAYLPRHLLLIPVFITVVAADLFVGPYGWAAMGFVYLAYLAGALVIAPGLGIVGPRTVLSAAALNAVVFYLVSNISQAMLFYPATYEGWIICYTNGLPFLARGILANVVFGSLAFGCIHLVSQHYAHRIALTQRN